MARGARKATTSLWRWCEAYRRHLGGAIVEPAHMELAEPSIAAAFARCVEQGATLVVIVPYFLAPGRHWNEDIPRLAAEAARPFPRVQHVVAPPLGIHPLMLQILDERVAEALGASMLRSEAR